MPPEGRLTTGRLPAHGGMVTSQRLTQTMIEHGPARRGPCSSRSGVLIPPSMCAAQGAPGRIRQLVYAAACRQWGVRDRRLVDDYASARERTKSLDDAPFIGIITMIDILELPPISSTSPSTIRSKEEAWLRPPRSRTHD